MDSKIQQKKILQQTENYIKKHFENEGSGHDWWHNNRVRNMAIKIAEKEGGDLFLIEMAALLHDLEDWKLSDNKNESKSLLWLKRMKISGTESNRIIEIIEQVSFKGAGVETNAFSTEAKIVQDADRLDAMGAIGIARTFAYGGSKGRLIYNPAIKPEMHTSFEKYKKTTAPTINHFYEKLLLLMERLNTKTAVEIGKRRHEFMEDFLKEFYAEWDDNCIELQE